MTKPQTSNSHSMNNISIRKATPTDLPAIIPLCAAHAAFENSTYDPTGKVELLQEHLFGTHPKAHCLVAEQDQKLIGYVTYMLQFSTWNAASYVYLDCIYLTATTRGKGIGTALMDQVYKFAAAENCAHIEWQTPDDNFDAIAFYKKLGATAKQKERFSWIVN